MGVTAPPQARDPEELGRALIRIERVAGNGLTDWIASLEEAFSGKQAASATELAANGVDEDLLAAALLVKGAECQINLVIHVVGILVSLPKILEPGEVVESLSLGAGNTGRAYDLETDRQVAEFTFIDWRGGPESIRQNKLFGDIVALAAAKTAKRRVLYVNGKDIPLRFLCNRRALSSVLNDRRSSAVSASSTGRASPPSATTGRPSTIGSRSSTLPLSSQR
jgi:hypothetical protein